MAIGILKLNAFQGIKILSDGNVNFIFFHKKTPRILENFVISSVYLDKSLSFTDVSECDVNLTVSSYNI